MTKARLIRITAASFFPAADVVAVHDQVDNIILINEVFASDTRLEKLATLMDEDGSAPILYLPAGYQPR